MPIDKAPALLALSMAALITLACDKVYEAHLSVAVPAKGRVNSDQIATELIAHLSKQFPLKCGKPEVWTAPPGSSETPEVHRECTYLRDYTDIVLVASGNELSVEINKIGGFQEPEGFRAIRLATESYLKQAVPGATVMIEPR